jgi:hypothetical protein
MRRRSPAPVAPCSNCGESKRLAGHGRCGACYMYWHRHGRDRPAEGIRHHREAGLPCSNCGHPAPSDQGGRCRPCAVYWRRHQRERPLPRPRCGPAPQPPRPCRVCGEGVRALRHGRCRRCAAYWDHFGRERPTTVRGGQARPVAPCPRCERPTREWIRGYCPACDRRRRTDDPAGWRSCAVCARVASLVRGRCLTCYNSWHRTGRERPLARARPY